jgi:hypothetical protein
MPSNWRSYICGICQVSVAQDKQTSDWAASKQVRPTLKGGLCWGAFLWRVTLVSCVQKKDTRHKYNHERKQHTHTHILARCRGLEWVTSHMLHNVISNGAVELLLIYGAFATPTVPETGYSRISNWWESGRKLLSSNQSAVRAFAWRIWGKKAKNLLEWSLSRPRFESGFSWIQAQLSVATCNQLPVQCT